MNQKFTNSASYQKMGQNVDYSCPKRRQKYFFFLIFFIFARFVAYQLQINKRIFETGTKGSGTGSKDPEILTRYRFSRFWEYRYCNP